MSINPLTFAVISAIIIVMLTLLYYFQNKESNASTKCYKTLLIITAINIVAVIVYYVVTYYNRDKILLDKCLLYGYKVTIMIYLIALYEYINIKLHNNSEDFKKTYKKDVLWIIPTFIILGVLAYFVKFDLFNEDGDVLIYSFSVFAIVSTFYTILTIIEGVKILKAKNKTAGKFLITTTIVFIIGNAIEILFAVVSVFPVCEAFVVIYVYFTYENPDLYVMETLNNARDQLKLSNTDEGKSIITMRESIEESINAIKELNKKINENGDFSEKQSDYKKIINHGNRILNILDNIFDNAIVSSTKENTEYSVDEIVNNIVNKYRYQADDKNVETTVYINPGTPSKFSGQKGKLEKLIRNIISNSLTYTEYGKINISINTEKIKDECKLQINISDTSDGINLESDKITGRKVNIFLAEKYVKELNGEIKLEDTYLAGTRVEIILPQVIVDPTPIKAKQSENDNQLAKDYHQMKVLVVDENKLNRKVLTSILKKFNFNVIECCSGEEAVNNIKSNEVYNLILLDHQMDDATGVEVMEALKKLKTFYKIPPVIMVSANTGNNLREYYLSVGFNEYIPKPITVNEIQQVIKKYVKLPKETTVVSDEEKNESIG